MREAITRRAHRASTPRPTTRGRHLRLVVGVAAASLLLAACGGDDPATSSDPGESPSSPSVSGSPSDPASPSPSTSPSPKPPKEPAFAPGSKGKRAFVRYIVNSWEWALQHNDPSPLLDASGKKPCRGCASLSKELRQRKKEGWHVNFPGAKVRKITFRRAGSVQVATATVDIPASRSFFDDGTFRNQNKAHKGAKFLIDIRIDGKGKKRHWTLVAFSIK